MKNPSQAKRREIDANWCPVAYCPFCDLPNYADGYGPKCEHYRGKYDYEQFGTNVVFENPGDK